MRVIAGALRGRRLEAPRGQGTRPTSDRVREALFSVLADVVGARVLDLYAGTGALGIEALSRGAAHATFVESARDALTALRANLKSLDLAARSTVIAAPAQRVVALGASGVLAGGPFDLVFADPPYAILPEAVLVLRSLVLREILAPAARVVLEHASRDEAPSIQGLLPARTRGYGDTSLTLYAPLEPPKDGEDR